MRENPYVYLLLLCNICLFDTVPLNAFGTNLLFKPIESAINSKGSAQTALFACAATLATLYGCYKLNRSVNMLVLCGLTISSYFLYRYFSDEEIKNLFVDGTNRINESIVESERRTDIKLKKIDEHCQATHKTILEFEIKMRADAMQQRIEIRRQLKELEERMVHEINEQTASIQAKLMELDQNFAQQMMQHEQHITEQFAEQTISMKHKLSQHKHNIIETLDCNRQEVKKEQHHLQQELLKTNELITESSTHTLTNIHMMLQELARAQALNVTFNSQPFLPGYTPSTITTSPAQKRNIKTKEMLKAKATWQREQTKAQLYAQHEACTQQLQQKHTALQQKLQTTLKSKRAMQESLLRDQKEHLDKWIAEEKAAWNEEQRELQSQSIEEIEFESVRDAPVFQRTTGLMHRLQSLSALPTRTIELTSTLLLMLRNMFGHAITNNNATNQT